MGSDCTQRRKAAFALRRKIDKDNKFAPALRIAQRGQRRVQGKALPRFFRHFLTRIKKWQSFPYETNLLSVSS